MVTGCSDDALEFGRWSATADGPRLWWEPEEPGSPVRRGKVVDLQGASLASVVVHAFAGELETPNLDRWVDLAWANAAGEFELGAKEETITLFVTTYGPNQIGFGRKLLGPVRLDPGEQPIELVVPERGPVEPFPPTWLALYCPWPGNARNERQPSELGRLLLAGPRWFQVVHGPPQRIDDLPTTDQGARLEVVAREGPGGDPVVEAILRAGSIPVFREVEHRYTVGISLLVALEADGVPVRVRPPEGGGRFGGNQSMQLLAPADGSWGWSLRIQRERLEELLPRPLPRRVGLTLAFCEFQHVSCGETWGAAPEGEPIVDFGLAVRRPILVRSERAFIERGPEGWRPAR